MSEDLVIRHCAPTLAGIKTGNLFSCACPCKAALTKELCRLNRKLVPKGIRILPLKVRKGRALIYVYRPNALECDLADHRSRGLLLRYGYTPGDSNRCVIHLIRHSPLPVRLLASLGVTDESFGIFTTGQAEDHTAAYFFGLITVTYSAWIAGTALGVFASGLLPDVLSADVKAGILSLLEISCITRMPVMQLSLLPVVCGLLSFGGICVFMQLLASGGNWMHKAEFLAMRLLAALLSAGLCRLAAPFWMRNVAVSAFAGTMRMTQSATPLLPILLVLMTFMILSQKKLDNSTKACYNNM